MENQLIHSIILTGLWIIYFLIHSLLASVAAKKWIAANIPGAMPYYRLFFNIVAVLSILTPLAYLYKHQTNYLWQWQGLAGWAANLIALVAVLLFIRTLRYYDTREFLGIRQLSNITTSVEDQETLRISPFHRYVRHPWYSIALVIIWTRDMDILFLLTAILLTLYFIFGSKLEEKKLTHYHGSVYQKYSQKVPGLIPRPWRFLSIQQAEQLLREYNCDSLN